MATLAAPLHAAQQPSHAFDVNGPASGYSDQPTGEPDALVMIGGMNVRVDDFAAAMIAAWPIVVDRLRAAPAAPPREPTEAMIQAGGEFLHIEHRPKALLNIWRAMWDAASAPAGSEGKETEK